MANNSQLNRRLLLAILRAPPFHVSSRSQFCCQKLVTRSVSTSSSRYAPPSVSFGEETDQLIAALEPQTSLPKKRSPRASQSGSENSHGAREPKKLILRRLERLDEMEQQKKKQAKGNNQEVNIDTRNSSNGTIEAKKKTKKAKTVSKEKSKSKPSVETKSQISTITSQDSDLYDEPVLLEIPEPDRISSSAPESIQKTKLTITRQKASSETIRVPSASSQPSPSDPKPQTPSFRSPGSEPWQVQKHALQKKFIEGWQPRKKLSPDTLIGIRSLHERDPEKFSTENLSRQFAVSPEAIRRILRTKWGMTPEQLEERRQRWAKRHDRIWDHKAELGQRPKRTRDKKIDGPEKFEELIFQKQALGEI